MVSIYSAAIDTVDRIECSEDSIVDVKCDGRELTVMWFRITRMGLRNVCPFSVNDSAADKGSSLQKVLLLTPQNGAKSCRVATCADS